MSKEEKIEEKKQIEVNNSIPKKSKKKKIINKSELKKKKIENSKKYVANLDEEAKEEALKELIKHLPKYDIKIEKKGPGRPLVITEEQLQILRVCLSANFSIKKALFIAKIKESTYYDFLERNPDFSEELEYIKESIDDQAIINAGLAVKLEQKIMQRIAKDPTERIIPIPNTKFRLTKKHKDFINKLQIDVGFSLVDLHKNLDFNNSLNEGKNNDGTKNK